jgi:hypothetical protein
MKWFNVRTPVESQRDVPVFFSRAILLFALEHLKGAEEFPAGVARFDRRIHQPQRGR